MVPDQFVHGVYQSYSPFKELEDKKVCTNYHRVVFKATSQTARLIISDWPSAARRDNALIGQETIFNFIEVEPYLMP